MLESIASSIIATQIVKGIDASIDKLLDSIEAFFKKNDNEVIDKNTFIIDKIDEINQQFTALNKDKDIEYTFRIDTDKFETLIEKNKKIVYIVRDFDSNYNRILKIDDEYFSVKNADVTIKVSCIRNKG